jgi:hypothetical protein
VTKQWRRRPTWRPYNSSWSERWRSGIGVCVAGASFFFFLLFFWEKGKYAGDAHDYIGSFYGLNVSKAC